MKRPVSLHIEKSERRRKRQPQLRRPVAYASGPACEGNTQLGQSVVNKSAKWPLRSPGQMFSGVTAGRAKVTRVASCFAARSRARCPSRTCRVRSASTGMLFPRFSLGVGACIRGRRDVIESRSRARNELAWQSRKLRPSRRQTPSWRD